ncbi:hypothetical protein ACSDR0_47945 [Streptosporangium sp. G11]|uniref:hypothetical protein n=1 Tax=Streptosporangium sp. G11 TaxID=3436926 RepID=UPI003EB814B6
MHRIRLIGPSIMLTSAWTIAACALTAAAAVTANPTAGAVQRAHSFPVQPPPSSPSPTPSPSEEEPCPHGEPKPCGASDKEKDKVESDRQAAEQEKETAKNDIAAFKDKATACDPKSKECMEAVIGNGAEQRAGMAAVQRELDGARTQSVGDAQLATDGTCGDFAAELSSLFGGSVPPQMTDTCERMN